MTDDLSLLMRRWGSLATGNRVKSQYREDSELPVGYLPMAAAGYLATIAYPDNWENRDKLVIALMAYIAKGAKELHGETRFPQEWRDVPAAKMRRQLRKAQNIIWFERFPASRAAAELLAVRVTEGSNLSVIGPDLVREVCNKYAPSSQISEGKFLERAWKPSKSVLHLVHPFRLSLTDEQSEWPLGRFVSSPQWVPSAIKTSHKIFRALTNQNIVKDRELILLHSA